MQARYFEYFRWVGRHWKPQYYWGGAATDSHACGCHPYCKPTERNSTCNCDANDKLAWLKDEGLLLDKNRLPVLQMRFGDTGQPNEAGRHTLGPLKCRHSTHQGKGLKKKNVMPSCERLYRPLLFGQLQFSDQWNNSILC